MRSFCRSDEMEGKTRDPPQTGSDQSDKDSEECDEQGAFLIIQGEGGPKNTTLDQFVHTPR